MENKDLGVLIFIASIIVGAILTHKGNKLINPEQKDSMIKAFSKLRMYNLIILLSIVALFFAIGYFHLLPVIINYLLYFLLLILFMLTSNAIIYRRLKTMNFPAEYIKSYLLSSSIRFLGIMAFIILSLKGN